MKLNVSIFICLLISFLFLSCSVSKEIIEDYHTDTYNDRMKHFADYPLLGGEIVFFGNSLTQSGKWGEYFPHADIVNYGISGDNTEGMLARIADAVGVKPGKIFIMAGINDISLSRSDKKILHNYREIIKQIRVTSPQTKIYIQSVLPINNDFAVYKRLKSKEERIVPINRKLLRLASDEDVEFVNLYPFFVDQEGKLFRNYTYDGLHLTDEAYYLWSNIIRNKVE